MITDNKLELKKRLIKRNQNSPKEIERRFHSYEEDVKHWNDYDYVIINKNLEMPALSNIPQNLDFEKKNLTAKILGIIDREWIALKINELFVIEFYSRKI